MRTADLERFLVAQRDAYAGVLRELRAGHKTDPIRDPTDGDPVVAARQVGRSDGHAV